MKNLMLVVNPAAGRGGYKYNFGEAMAALGEGGFCTTLYFTSGRGDAIEFAAEHARYYDVAACVGGDGTLSELISGLMRLAPDERPPIGYFPMGTTNDVASTIGLPKNNTVEAARRIVRGAAHEYDVGGFNYDAYFAYVAAFGAFTEVSYETPQSRKKALGHLAYVLGGASALQRIEGIDARIEYDGGVVEGRFLYGSMTNSTSIAGIMKLPNGMVSLGDGESELVLVRDPGSLDGLSEIISSAITQKYDSENLLILHTRSAKFSFDKPVAWTRDGEAGGEYQELTLTNHKAAVKLIF